MASKETASILDKDFVTLKIDVDRTIEGDEVLARYGGEGKGLPWFVFLDAEGETLATSEGPAGNLGCPYRDDEIAAFAQILGRVARAISPEDIAALTKSLTAQRKKDEKR